MAYEMVMPYHLHMPSYFLETFTEYPYLRNVLEMTGCFNSACSAIIREKWMLFAYFYYAQFSFMKLASSFLGFLFLIVIAVKELFPVVFRFGTAFFNVATFRTAGSSFF